MVLPPESVASMERRFLPYLKVKGKDAEIPVVVGIPVKTTLSIATTKDDCDYMLKQFENKNYLLSFCSYVGFVIFHYCIETRFVSIISES